MSEIKKLNSFSVSCNIYRPWDGCSLTLYNEDADGNTSDDVYIDLSPKEIDSLIKMLSYGKEITLKSLVGAHVLSGIETGETEVNGKEAECVWFELDGKTYEVAEDPDDGYRSYLGKINKVYKRCRYRIPDIPVICVLNDKDNESGEECEILEFKDAKNDNIILRIGTANTDDYYPYCVIEYIPENMSCNVKKY